MADLSYLGKQLQEQVDVITKYFAKENLPSPTFMPEGDVLKPPIASLPPDVEKARKKAHALSWNINRLLTPPFAQAMWPAFEVALIHTYTNLVLRACCTALHSRVSNPQDNPDRFTWCAHLRTLKEIRHPREPSHPSHSAVDRNQHLPRIFPKGLRAHSRLRLALET